MEDLSYVESKGRNAGMEDGGLHFIGGRACEGISNHMDIFVEAYDDAIHLDVRSRRQLPSLHDRAPILALVSCCFFLLVKICFGLGSCLNADVDLLANA